MTNLTLLDVIILLTAVVVLGVLSIYLFALKAKFTKKKTELSNNSACKKALSDHRKRLYTDYFWSDSTRFAWILLFLVFFILLGLALAYKTTGLFSIINLVTSLVFLLLTVLFLFFSYKSYNAFPTKAAERLKAFEAQVDVAIKKEISFEGDNIQSFSDDDEAFDTTPKVFAFPTGITKIQFPPFEKNAKKQPIIATKKIEFLILSREYFSICKGAATFDLLNPKRGAAAKQCAEVAGSAGECNEHYYSQMRNVEYDGTKECIRIIYYDQRDDVEFSCKKAAPNRKPAMKALKEKLRLTERQRLQKINEHEKYEEIMDRRIIKDDGTSDTEEKEEDNSSDS